MSKTLSLLIASLFAASAFAADVPATAAPAAEAKPAVEAKTPAKAEKRVHKGHKHQKTEKAVAPVAK